MKQVVESGALSGNEKRAKTYVVFFGGNLS